MEITSNEGIGSIEELEDQIDALCSERNALHSSIREKKNRMKEINELRQAIRDYRRTKDVYAQYKASGWSPKFYNHFHPEVPAADAQRAMDYVATQGQIVLINCNRPHSYHVTSNCDFVFFHLAGNNSDDIVDELIATNGGILFQLPNARVLFQKAQNYLDTLLEGGSPSEAALSSFVYETLCNLRLKGLETLMQKDSTQGSMSKVLSYIRDHVKEPLSLEQLSEIAYMSKYHFLRSFQKEYGVTPFQYIAEMRMSLSKTMLTTTNLSIAQIAYDLGYSNESAFIRAFTRIVGISPGKFKRGLQG